MAARAVVAAAGRAATPSAVGRGLASAASAAASGTGSAAASTPAYEFSAEQKYMFDLQGFLVIRGVLTAAEVAAGNAAIDRHHADFVERAQAIRNTRADSGFGSVKGGRQETGEAEAASYAGRLENGTFLTQWPADDAHVFRRCLAHPQLVPVLNGLVGPGHRLDHMPLILRQRHLTEGFDLHGGRVGVNGSFNRELAYHFEHGQPCCSLLAMSVQLTDSGPGDGGFCIVPGTHKANYPPPRSLLTDKDSPLLTHPVLKAGDVVFFSEATMHGASCWTRKDTDRRIALYRFAPANHGYGRGYLEGWPETFLDEIAPAERAVLAPPYGLRLDRVSTVDGVTAVHQPRSTLKKKFDSRIFEREYF